MPWFHLAWMGHLCSLRNHQEDSADAGRDSNLPDLDGVCLEKFCPGSHVFFSIRFVYPLCSPGEPSPLLWACQSKTPLVLVTVQEDDSPETALLFASLIPTGSGFLLLSLALTFARSPVTIPLQALYPLLISKFKKFLPSCFFPCLI